MSAMQDDDPEDGRAGAAVDDHPGRHGGPCRRASGLQLSSQDRDGTGGAAAARGRPLPPNVEAQLSLLEAQAAKQVLEQSKSEAAQAAAQAALQDPVVQMQQRELDIKQSEVDRKSRDDSMRTFVDVAKLIANSDNQFALIEERSAAADARTDTQIDTAQIRANATVDAARIKAAADVMRSVLPGMMGLNDGSNGPLEQGALVYS